MTYGCWRALGSRRYVMAVCALVTVLLFHPPVLAGTTPVARQPAPRGRLIIRLVGEPLIRQGLVRVQNGAPALDTAQLAEPLARLQAQGERVMAAIGRELPGAEAVYRYQVAFNGLAVRLPEGEEPERALVRLRSLAEVAAVYDEAAFEPALYDSVPFIGATALWPTVGGQGQAGAGVRIAILDSGIDISHPMFTPTGFSYPSGFPKGDTRYTTQKVIVARAYFRPTEPPLGGEDTAVPGAHGSGHGTQVAGVAAGVPVTAQFREVSTNLSGVAPRAWLMNYRLFYPPASGGPERAYTAEILQAIDDAVADGAQVILNSWTNATPRLPFAAPEAEALEAAMEAGCVVVAPAGNTGPGYGSTSLVPGGVARVITVGGASKDHAVGWGFVDVAEPQPVDPDLENLPFGRALFGPSITALIGPYPYTRVAGSACTPLAAGSLSNRIALIPRGDCFFADKVYNAQQAGARAVIILSDTDEVTDMRCEGQRCDAGEITIPAVLVSQTAGQELIAWLNAYAQATLQLDPGARIVGTPSDVVGPESGRGPAYARALKPDLLAPGVLVLTADHAAGQGQPPYAQVSGTSIAAAHIAGAAALLVQAHPGWSHDEVKAALMATARTSGVRAIDPETGMSLTASVLDRGAGVVNLAALATPSIGFDPPSLALPNALPDSEHTLPVSVRDLRTSGGSRTYTVSFTQGYGLSASAAPQITLAPGETKVLNIVLDVLPQAPIGDLQAELRLTNSSTQTHLPIWVHVAPRHTGAQVLVIDNDFSFTNSYADYAHVVTATLQAAGYTYQVWNADQHYDHPQTLPDLHILQQYNAVLWLTGDNIHPNGYYVVETPLTLIDQQILASYLDAGGRLLAAGQNLAEASDVNPDSDSIWGRSTLYHHYLGAHWLKGNLFGGQPPQGGAAVLGAPGSLLANTSLNLGPVGDGEGNQTSVDEIALGGVRDGSDLNLVRPIAVAVGGSPAEAGYVGVAKADEPTLEDETLSVPYRTVYYSFGLEGINNIQGVTSRADFLDRTLDWLLDEVTVTLSDAHSEANALVTLNAQASSTRGATITAYRWRFGSGAGAQIIEGATPSVSRVYAEEGIFPVAVEVTDALGHKAVAQATVTITKGGGSTLTVNRSTALPGAELIYQVVATNGSGSSLAMSFSLPVPEGTEYVSHAGGSFTGNTLSWSATLPADSTFSAALRVRVPRNAPGGEDIVATASFRAGEDTFTRTATTRVLAGLCLPLVLRS